MQGRILRNVDSIMSAGAWKNAKAVGAIQPAGQVTPGPKGWTGQDDPDVAAFKDWIPEAKWTQGMRAVAEFAQRMAERSAGCAPKASGSVPSLSPAIRIDLRPKRGILHGNQ
jgi:hypothetical protein